MHILRLLFPHCRNVSQGGGCQKGRAGGPPCAGAFGGRAAAVGAPCDAAAAAAARAVLCVTRQAPCASVLRLSCDLADLSKYMANSGSLGGPVILRPLFALTLNRSISSHTDSFGAGWAHAPCRRVIAAARLPDAMQTVLASFALVVLLQTVLAFTLSLLPPIVKVCCLVLPLVVRRSVGRQKVCWHSHLTGQLTVLTVAMPLVKKSDTSSPVGKLSNINRCTAEDQCIAEA